jgi:hypothetical protein
MRELAIVVSKMGDFSMPERKQQLNEPDVELVARIMSEVDFDHRLVGNRVRPRWGSIHADLYSVREVALLLSDKHPAIELDRLQEWIRTTIGDDELADRLGDVQTLHVSDRELLQRVRLLLDERLEQCRSVTKLTEPGGG